jgi:hypothetical protein
MFNNYSFSSKIQNTLKINACSGGIYKTYKESWFTRFHLKSDIAEKLFKPYDNQMQVERDTNEWCDAIGRYYMRNGTSKEVIILQMVICGDMEVIAELITKEDFDKYFEKLEIRNEVEKDVE